MKEGKIRGAVKGVIGEKSSKQVLPPPAPQPTYNLTVTKSPALKTQSLGRALRNSRKEVEVDARHLPLLSPNTLVSACDQAFKDGVAYAQSHGRGLRSCSFPELLETKWNGNTAHMAHDLGVTRRAVQLWISGDRPVNETALRLARICTPSEGFPLGKL